MHPNEVSYDLLDGEAPEFDTTSLTRDVETTPIPTSRNVGREKEPGTEGPLRVSTLGSAPPPPLTEEERLRRQLFDMQKINGAFGAYYDALTAVRDRQQSLATKVNQTKQLLDRYVAILGQAEHNARLILDPNWQGAEAEAARLEEIRRREEESLRLEREAAQRKGEEERARREAEERLEAEKVHAAAARIRGGVRGSARARGVPLSTAGRGSRVSAPGATRTPSAPRPPSSAAMRAPSSGGGSTGSAGTRGSAQPSGIKPPAAGRGIARGIRRGKPVGT